MDPLSDVIRAVRLSGAYFYRVEASPPWSARTVAARDLIPRIMRDAEHIISYHILLSGRCWGGLDDEAQSMMQPGDVIVFPHGDPHLLSSHDWRTRHEAPNTVTSPSPFRETVYLGPEDNRDTTFVCGFLGCDLRPFNPLLSSLPRCVLARGIASGWIATLSNQVVHEFRNSRVGNDTVLTRMAELLFIEVVRRLVEETPAEQVGWLAGLVDPVVGPALSQLHEEPARGWTLPDLARACATSRSVLADRFARVIGVSPMLYLKRWRLQLAAEELARGTAKVAAIATRVGYDSEAAFSRAFKQETGESPAAWRRARQAQSA